MKVFLVLSALVAVSLAAAPQRPSGRLIVLPGRQQNPPAKPADQSPKPQEAQSDKVVDSGEYYVLTPEGKLQMVKYTTAALKDQSAQPKPAQVVQQPEPFAQFQVEYLQYPGFVQQAAAPSQTKADHKKKPKADYKKSEDAADFEARLEYRDVKPIPAPIYAYNPEPLVRILKK